VQDEGYDIIEKDSKDALYIRYLMPHILMIWRTLSAQTVYSSSDSNTVQQSSVTHAVIASTRSSSSTYCVLSAVNSDSTLAVACMAAAFGTLRSSTLAPSDCDVDSKSSSGDACANIADSSNSADTEQVPTDYTLQAPLMAAPVGDDICCSWLSVNSIITDSLSRGTDSSSTDKRPFEGAILLAQRGDCQFAEKARIAAAGGAAALIIVNSASAPENDAMFVMHGFDSDSAAKSDTALRKRCARKLHSNQHYCAGVLDSSSSSSSSSSRAAVSIPVVLVSNSAGVALQQQLQQQRDLQLQLSVTTLPYAEFNRSPYYTPIVSRSTSSGSTSSSSELIDRDSPYSLQVFSAASAGDDQYGSIVSISGSENWGIVLARNEQQQPATVDAFVFDASDTTSEQHLWEQQHEHIFSR
jgi:PA domain